MAYQETTRQSYGSKVKNSFQGILWGIILILAGTVILWWNEGRAVKASDALKDFQKNYVELSDITTLDPAFEGKAVHATGVAVTADTLRDAAFGIAVNAMKLARNVEYYQWTQQSESERKDKLGGSTETTTTYTYEPAWCNEPVNSNEFKDPDYKGKNFVLRAVEATEQTASNVSFGAYRLTEGIVSRISGEEPAYPALTEAQKKQLLANVTDSTVVVTVSGDQVYIGADPANPRIGDVRITFTQVTSPKTVSLLQKVVNGTFESYIAKNGKAFSKVEMGTVSAENMIEHQKSANKTLLWILRIVGIILIIAGNKSLLGFLSTVFAVVPFIQRIIGAGVGFVATVIGLVWSLIVIAIAWVTHRPVLAIALLAVAVVLTVWLVGRSRKKKTADVVAVLVICLMIGVSCTGGKTQQPQGGDSQVASTDVKGPVKTMTVMTLYGEGEPGITQYEFDEKGKLISEKEIMEYEEDEGINEALSEKDEKGRYIKEVWGSGDEIYSYQLYQYDDKDNVTFVEYHQGDGTLSSTNWNTYDEAGHLLTSTTQNSYGTYEATYEYDDKGLLVKNTSSFNGEVSSYSTYEHDEAGRDIHVYSNNPTTGHESWNYTSYDKNGELIGYTSYQKDENGTRMNRQDTIFFGKDGMKHERIYEHYAENDEKRYESIFNKQGYITHFELLDPATAQPAYVIDFTFGPDGTTLREMNCREVVPGQEKSVYTKTFIEEVDTFGNWTLRTQGLSYCFDMMDMGPEGLVELLPAIHRKLEYRGEDQGQNYGFEGRNGDSELRLRWTNDDGVLLGEATLDGVTKRIVGNKDEDETAWHIVALEKDGTIPWHLYLDPGENPCTATIVKGMDERKFPMTATRDGVKTYRFKADPDDLVGLYEYKDEGGDTGEGTLDVSRCGEDWEDYKFEIANCGPAPSHNMASDTFVSSPSETLEYYNYLWDENSETNFTYKIRFFDGFAVIQRTSGSPMGFFGMGMTVEGIYAKLPSVG